jgi:hypothetical protein
MKMSWGRDSLRRHHAVSVRLRALQHDTAPTTPTTTATM